MLRTIRATRYVTPLREGGSLPAIVEADDLRPVRREVSRRRTGPAALIAELIAGEIGRALGLHVPEIVFVELDAALGRNEPDYEIRELLKRQRRAQPGARLSARLDHVRSAGRRSADVAAGVADRLVRCVRHQRRPHAEEHEPAGTGTATCGSSITARRCTSITTGRDFEAQPEPLSRAIKASRAAAVGQRRIHEAAAASLRAGSDARGLRATSSTRFPTRGSARARFPTPTSTRRLRRLSAPTR